MKHRIMTCRNHQNLRWSAKEIAVSGENPGDPARYNGRRLIFFDGIPSGKGMFSDNSGLDCTDVNSDGTIVKECDCPSSDLIIAPEDTGPSDDN